MTFKMAGGRTRYPTKLMVSRAETPLILRILLFVSDLNIIYTTLKHNYLKIDQTCSIFDRKSQGTVIKAI